MIKVVDEVLADTPNQASSGHCLRGCCGAVYSCSIVQHRSSAFPTIRVDFNGSLAHSKSHIADVVDVKCKMWCTLRLNCATMLDVQD